MAAKIIVLSDWPRFQKSSQKLQIWWNLLHGRNVSNGIYFMV